MTNNISHKIYIDTLGCFKNIEDSERAAGLLEASGFGLTDTPESADVIVVNTCGFIDDAKRESIDRVFELIQHKERGAKLIVSGCLAQRYPEEIFTEISEANAVIGVNEYGSLPEIVARLVDATPDKNDGRESRREGAVVCATDVVANGTEDVISKTRNVSYNASNGRILQTGGEPSILTGPRTRIGSGANARATAYLKVAEGCNNRCAYCAIPAIRGPYRSVPPEVLANEAASLAGSGARELILIAQDVSAYGSDFESVRGGEGGRRSGNNALPELIDRLCEAVDGIGATNRAAASPSSSVIASEAKQSTHLSESASGGVEWLRLMYCYEERVTDELIEAIAKRDKVCNYIDIPLQHISDSVLKRMGRRSTQASIENTIKRLRKAIPDIAIRTTLMTGFPGETEDDFAKLMDFVTEQRFERLGVFAYSPEDGTRAAEMPDQIPRETAEERRDAIMQAQLDISLEQNRRFIGRTLKVLVESIDGDNENIADTSDSAKNVKQEQYCYTGRTEYDAPEIDGSVIFTSNNPLKTGTFTKVIITDAMDYDLVGVSTG